MDNWVSVNERVPKLDEYVILQDDTGAVREGVKQPFGFLTGLKGKVCYWMPFPEPHKTEKVG